MSPALKAEAAGSMAENWGLSAAWDVAETRWTQNTHLSPEISEGHGDWWGCFGEPHWAAGGRAQGERCHLAFLCPCPQWPSGRSNALRRNSSLSSSPWPQEDFTEHVWNPQSVQGGKKPWSHVVGEEPANATLVLEWRPVGHTARCDQLGIGVRVCQ